MTPAQIAIKILEQEKQFSIWCDANSNGAFTPTEIPCVDGLDIALDVLGCPADNTVETNACDIANATGKWPDWAFCRDSYRNDFESDVVSGRQSVEDFVCETIELLTTIPKLPDPPKP